MKQYKEFFVGLGFGCLILLGLILMWNCQNIAEFFYDLQTRKPGGVLITYKIISWHFLAGLGPLITGVMCCVTGIVYFFRKYL